jgi:phosphatidate cytidylyltransferase
MSSELKKRIITSFLLFFLVILSFFTHQNVFFMLIISISLLCTIEINTLLHRIFDYSKVLLFSFLAFFYFFIFFGIGSITLFLYQGSSFLFLILLTCIFSDIGGYIIGKNIGGKKLTKISPNKTVSGSIGSFSFSIFPLLIFDLFLQEQIEFNIINILFFLEVSLVSQLGDIFVSYIKRKAKVKDTGNILPGHGGLLDRIDGIVFAVPFSCFYLYGFSYFDLFMNSLY